MSAVSTASPAPATPYLPLTRPTIDEETIAGVVEVLRSGWITSGPKVKELEAKLSAYFGGRPVRVFNSGTCTMEIALRIAGVGAGDEVITTPLSWVATSNVILEVGATPRFVDIDPVTRNIDLEKVEAAITPATKAIIPVDLAGLPVDRDRLHAIARKHGLRVIEDAAQSMGANWKGRRIGAEGDFVSISFHPNKNITTIEGGCLVMNTEAEAKLAEQYRLQGVVRSGFDGMAVEVVGGKFNLTDVAARVGLGQLPRLEEFNARRRELARAYFEELDTTALRALGLELPVADFAQSNWHMFQVVLPDAGHGDDESRRKAAPTAGDGRARGAPLRVDACAEAGDGRAQGAPLRRERAEVMATLHAAGIGTGVHYPAIHLFGVYRRLGWKEGDFPIAERVCRNILTLPLFPTMTREDVSRVARELTKVLQSNQKS